MGGGLVSRISTQSPSPSLLFPEGVKVRAPEFVNGEPAIER